MVVLINPVARSVHIALGHVFLGRALRQVYRPFDFQSLLIELVLMALIQLKPVISRKELLTVASGAHLIEFIATLGATKRRLTLTLLMIQDAVGVLVILTAAPHDWCSDSHHALELQVWMGATQVGFWCYAASLALLASRLLTF